jgi:hypothetical protein
MAGVFSNTEILFLQNDNPMTDNHPLRLVSFRASGTLAVSCTVFAILLGLSPDLAMAKTSPENEPDTKVTQVVYFDFFGATLWMNYPWYGGMRHYLHYTARWEQETITRLIDRYR